MSSQNKLADGNVVTSNSTGYFINTANSGRAVGIFTNNVEKIQASDNQSYIKSSNASNNSQFTVNDGYATCTVSGNTILQVNPYNTNLYGLSFSSTTTTTSSTTLVLNNTSTILQIISGSTSNQIVQLPSTTTLNLIQMYKILNLTTGNTITVQTHGGTSFTGMIGTLTCQTYTCINTSTDGIGSWFVGII